MDTIVRLGYAEPGYKVATAGEGYAGIVRFVTSEGADGADGGLECHGQRSSTEIADGLR
jgi:hypothetical protein